MPSQIRWHSRIPPSPIRQSVEYSRYERTAWDVHHYRAHQAARRAICTVRINRTIENLAGSRCCHGHSDRHADHRSHDAYLRKLDVLSATRATAALERRQNRRVGSLRVGDLDLEGLRRQRYEMHEQTAFAGKARTVVHGSRRLPAGAAKTRDHCKKSDTPHHSRVPLMPDDDSVPSSYAVK